MLTVICEIIHQLICETYNCTTNYTYLEEVVKRFKPKSQIQTIVLISMSINFALHQPLQCTLPETRLQAYSQTPATQLLICKDIASLWITQCLCLTDGKQQLYSAARLLVILTATASLLTLSPVQQQNQPKSCAFQSGSCLWVALSSPSWLGRAPVQDVCQAFCLRTGLECFQLRVSKIFWGLTLPEEAISLQLPFLSFA